MNFRYRTMPAVRWQRAQGFTLLELMVTIIIVAVVAGFALPSMNNLVLKHRAQDAASGMFATLFKARSEALRLNDINHVVNVGPITSTDWTSGWQITHDNGTTTDILDEHQPLIKAVSGATGQQGIAVTFSGGGPPITYNAAGRVTSGTARFTFTASNKAGTYSCTYKVTIDPSGRPSQTSTGVNGTDVATGGGAPTC